MTKEQGISGISSIRDELDAILNSSDDEFSVAKYLNLALSSNNSSTTTEYDNDNEKDKDMQRRMTELALELQFMTQSCHEEIGKIGIELQAILPRCAADVNRLSIGLNGLQKDAEQLLYDTTGKRIKTTTTTKTTSSSNNNNNKQQQIQQIQQILFNNTEETKSFIVEENDETVVDDTNIPPMVSTIEVLSTLHALQTNLRRTEEILTAAATWDETVESITPLLSAAAAASTATTTTGSTSNLTSAGTALVQAVQSFLQLEHGEKSLRGMPNPEERQQSVQKIRYQISSLLQPQLKYALASMSHSTTTTGTSSTTTTTGSSGSGSSTNVSHIALQQCIQLYSQLGQIETFKNEYIKQRPIVNGIHKLWFEYKPPLPGQVSVLVQQQQQQQTSFFVEWLPSWFDSVLTLISEERRQCTIIFGTSKQQQQQQQLGEHSNLYMVPEVIIRILIECFRPILPSFQSRLETICPSSTAATVRTGTTEGGTIRDIASIYEGMLRFLSIVYESITSGWIDMIESGSITVVTNAISKTTTDSAMMILNNAPALYRELTKVFIQIMSPFKPYQINLSKLETKFVQQNLSSLSQQVQSIVKTVTDNKNIESGWEVLQSTSMDELLSMPNLIIPVIDDTISRHELLNGGHDTESLLQTIDQIVTTYASVLGRAVQTLSSTLVTDSFNDTDSKSASSSTPPPIFDELNVLCALQVLKLAGTYKRTLLSLQMKTSDRLRILSERRAAQYSRDKQVTDSLHLMSLGKNSSFQIPETISLIEIDAVVIDATLSSTDGTNEIFENTIGTDASQLFPNGMSSSTKLASSCHTFVFDVCFAIPRYHLNNTSSMASWKESQSLMETWGGSIGGSTNAAASSSYGTLPQSFITQVGEHMLALVQALEPFAEDRDALTLSNVVMENDIVRQVAMPYWNDFIVAATGSPNTEESLKTIMEGKELLDLVIGVIPVDDEGNVEDGSEEGTTASTVFCNKWLDVVGLAVAGRLLERIMCIPSLTRKGCEHMNADLGYIVNVFSALGISGHPHPLLGHIAEICILDKDIVFDRIDNLDRSNPSSAFLRSVEERLSAMRGLM